MKKSILIFISGFLVGVFSWAICSVVSDRFEPFDTGLGLAIGQLALCAFSFTVSWRLGLAQMTSGLVGAYIGQNLYAYTFGDSETAAWAGLLLLTSLVLLMLPLILGLLARGIRQYLR